MKYEFRVWNPVAGAMEYRHRLSCADLIDRPFGCVPLMCTGIRDKKNEKIWEGDIVDIHESKALVDRGIVEFDEEEAAFRVRLLSGQLHHYVGPWKWAIRVIGNQYENPKLLRKEKK